MCIFIIILYVLMECFKMKIICAKIRLEYENMEIER